MICKNIVLERITGKSKDFSLRDISNSEERNTNIVRIKR